MPNTTITGTLIATELGSSEAVATLEAIIDSAIDAVNSDANLSIPHMSGTSPDKTITVTGDQAAAIKPMVAMKLASKSAKGASSKGFSLQGVALNQSTSTTPNDVNTAQYERAIRKLRENDWSRAFI